MKRIISKLLDLFKTSTPDEEYLVWDWESKAERDAFIKHFRFCN